MADWKDALSQLRDSGKIPEDNSPEPADIPEKPLKHSGTIHLVVEKKGRGGKIATIAEGFSCDDTALAELASEARRKLGTGGSARGGEILMQGECRERFAAFLRDKGYKVK